jgi:hypothetical protein
MRTDSRHEFSPIELAFVRIIHLRPFFPFPFAFLPGASRHFIRPKGKLSVRHYRYFLPISQQKPGKRYFGEKKILNCGWTQINTNKNR